MQIDLTAAEVIVLRDWIADDADPAPVVLSVGEGHGGFGLYVWTEDYPEEGAVFIKPLPQPAGATAEQINKQEAALLLNRLILMVSLKATQDPGLPDDERITDAEVDALEARILALFEKGVK